MFLLGGDGRVLVLMQGFLDFLFDLEWGSIKCGGCDDDFRKVGNMGGATALRECAEYRIWSGFSTEMLYCMLLAFIYLFE